MGGLRGKRILDFGCGNGTTACAVAATCEATSVEGVDINREHEGCARLVREYLDIDLPSSLTFRTLKAGEKLERGRYDIAYSWSVFEHIEPNLLSPIAANIRESLQPAGLFFVQVAPLYYSADGAHLMHHGVRAWEHLIWPLNQLRAQILERSQAPEETRRVDWSCFETLNKITADDLVDVICAAGFRLIRRYQTPTAQEPSEKLLRAFQRDVLKTEQIVALFGADSE
jgi:cyclopropane fatty-acyl-phospholipid synthase-like methyltransferase